MQEHVKRMVAEYDQLNEKITKLRAFLHKLGGMDEFPPGMDAADLVLLEQQEGFMRSYLTSLEQRLARAGVRVDAREPQELTFGMKLVGIDFNPSGDPKVTELKQLAARMADIVNEHNAPGTTPESGYLNSTFKGGAIRRILDGQMWAVKHVTNKH